MYLHNLSFRCRGIMWFMSKRKPENTRWSFRQVASMTSAWLLGGLAIEQRSVFFAAQCLSPRVVVLVLQSKTKGFGLMFGMWIYPIHMIYPCIAIPFGINVITTWNSLKFRDTLESRTCIIILFLCHYFVH